MVVNQFCMLQSRSEGVVGLFLREDAQDEDLSISRIVVLEEDNPILEAIHKAVNVKHGKVEVKDSNFYGVQITQACISTFSAADPTVKH